MATYSVIKTVDGVELATFSYQCERFYLLENGETEPIFILIAYCHDCRQFVMSERVLSPQQADEEIRKWSTIITPKSDREPRPAPQLQELIDNWEKYLTGLGRRRDLFQNRQTPPRCLECGSMDLHQELIGMDGEPLGRLPLSPFYESDLIVTHDSSFESLAFGEADRFYDLNGIEIRCADKA